MNAFTDSSIDRLRELDPFDFEGEACAQHSLASQNQDTLSGHFLTSSIASAVNDANGAAYGCVDWFRYPHGKSPQDVTSRWNFRF